MSEFLLAGARGPARGELCLEAAARDLVAAAGWHVWLRRWGLLRSFALPLGGACEPSACLVVRATSADAAARLAAGWEQLSGYRVTVLQLFDQAAPQEPPS
jgi:hypothetical protein